MSSKYQPLQDSDDLDQIPSSSKPGKRERHVVFAIDDDDEEEGPSLDRYADEDHAPFRSSSLNLNHAVAPPLKSTVRSREAGRFDLLALKRYVLQHS